MFNDKIILKSQQRFRSYDHKVYTEEVNKIALSSKDDKRLQTFDKITTYPYGTKIFKVGEREMLTKNKLSESDEDKNIPKDKDKDKTKTITKIEDKDKATIITKVKDKTTTKIKDKTTTKTKTEDKDEDIDMDENRLIQMFQYAKLRRNKKKTVIG